MKTKIIIAALLLLLASQPKTETAKPHSREKFTSARIAKVEKGEKINVRVENSR